MFFLLVTAPLIAPVVLPFALAVIAPIAAIF